MRIKVVGEWVKGNVIWWVVEKVEVVWVEWWMENGVENVGFG